MVDVRRIVEVSLGGPCVCICVGNGYVLRGGWSEKKLLRFFDYVAPQLLLN